MGFRSTEKGVEYSGTAVPPGLWRLLLDAFAQAGETMRRWLP